jgi:hypothetical protein
MGDGKRQLNLSLTEAQFDVLQAAIDTAWNHWHYSERSRDRQTLMRASGQLVVAWQDGSRS